jgi:hypothetical protein
MSTLIQPKPPGRKTAIDWVPKQYSIEGWDPWNYPINYVLVGGKKSPGIAEIVGASDVRGYDERRGYGLSGAYCIFKGKELAKWSIKLRFYEPQDYLDWQQWKKLINKVPTKQLPNALDIWHPQLEELGIKSFQLKELPQAVQEQDGLWVVDIKCIEFRKPKLAVAKADASKPQAPESVKDKKIRELTGQVQVLRQHGKPVGPIQQ